MIIPNTDVNLATEVRDVLSGAGGDVDANEIISFFKEDANINKWAKYKPESFKKDFDLTDDDRFSNNYGFDVSTIGGWGNLMISNQFELAKNDKTWIYILPKGGSNSPYRLGDFRSYNTEAEPYFIYNSIPTELTARVDSYSGLSFRVKLNKSAEIIPHDMAISTSGMQYFFLLRKNREYKYSSYVSQSSISSSSTELIFEIPTLEYGTWEWMFCLGPKDTETDTSYIEQRTDSLVMPEGYGTLELTKIITYISVKQESPKLSISYIDSEYQLHFDNSGMVTVGVYTTEQFTEPIRLNKPLYYGYQLELRNSQNVTLDNAEIYFTNNAFTYGGVSNVTNGTGYYNYESHNLVDVEGIVDLTRYFSSSQLQNANKLIIRPALKDEAPGSNGVIIDSDPDDWATIAVP